MDSLCDDIVWYILSRLSNAQDVAVCNCVSKQWKALTPEIRSLHFPRILIKTPVAGLTNNIVISRMISSVRNLEELVVYCPFSGPDLESWLHMVGPSLRRLELRIDDGESVSPVNLECLKLAENLESLILWGFVIKLPLIWPVFHKLKNLEIVGGSMDDPALNTVLCACPNLSNLLIRANGLTTVSIELEHLEWCKFDDCGSTNCDLTINSPKIQLLDVQGCISIIVPRMNFLTSLSISSSAFLGILEMVDFDKLFSLEFLSMRAIEWNWNAIRNILVEKEVKHFYMKVEHIEDPSFLLQPLQEVDFVDILNNHPNLKKMFDLDGVVFSAFSYPGNLKNVNPFFEIPSLEEVSVSLEEVSVEIREPINAKERIETLNSRMRHFFLLFLIE